MAPMMRRGSTPDATDSGTGRCIYRPAGGAEIHATLIEGVDGHGIAQNVYVAVVLRQTFGKRFPLVPARATAVHAQLAIGREVLPVAFDGDHVDSLRLVRVYVDHEPEVGGQVSADLVPRVAGVVAAHDVPVLLHKEHVRARAVHGDVVKDRKSVV